MWNRIAAFFKRSETIFLARVHVLLAMIAGAASYVDPSLVQPLLTPQNFAIYLLVNGILTEYARRRRDPDLGKQK